MSSTSEILKEYEELLKEKSQLKIMLESMEETEKHIRKKLRILEEKLAVQELEEKVKAKRVVVERLESKKRDLEKRLKNPYMQ